jgi:cobalt-zinc-cadmium efflux system outer membrane protein
MLARPRSVRLVRRLLLAASVVLSCALAGPAAAEEAPLTRARVAELLRVAPSSRAADARTRAAAAALNAAGATTALEEPVLSALGGVRFQPDAQRSFSAVASLSVPLDLGGQSAAQGDAARAELRAASATRDAEGQRALLGALLQHARVLRDERQLTLARERRVLAARLVAAAEKRRLAGSVGALDVTLASLQDRRDASFEAAAAGERDAERLELWAQLGLSASVEMAVTGDLVPSAEPPSLAALVTDTDGRADVRAARAEVLAAQTRAAQERAARWPAPSLLAQYERDDGANIGLAGLALPLPLFNGNRLAIATSAAEVGVAEAQLELATQQAEGAIRGLWSRYRSTKAVWEALTPTAALAAEAVSLATRSYELGEGDLASVLLARREAIEAQMALLEAEHAHGSAKIELLVAAGRSVP